jgi:hypothetical protein
MFIKNNTHVPFAQLPFEHRVLFHLLSFSAYEYHCCSPHTSAEIQEDLARVWDCEQLSPEDLEDSGRMSELLQTQLTNCVSPGRLSIQEEANIRGRHK